MTDSESGDDRFARIAESFVERYQRGERPSVERYIADYPEFADQIRELFPALEVLEELAPNSGDLSSHGPTTDLNVPESIGGYRVLREIGRGGMGIVYEAEQPGLRRRVALKVLPSHVRKDAAALERFRRESQAAAGLQHPNIVPVYEVGEDDTHAYYVMQFVDGQGLDAVLTELRRLRNASPQPGDARPTSEHPHSAAFTAHSLLTGRFGEFTENRTDESRPRDAESATTSIGLLPELDSTVDSTPNRYYRSLTHVGAQAARALAHAHTNGVVHRDIKPSNLLLDSTGNLWVTDFGLAKADEDGLTQTGDIVGTLRYMAPERFHGWADPRSDVYSMGMTLYEMMALRPAFATLDRVRLMQQISEVGPPRPRSVDARIPHDLETIILKTIEREPARRYQSADELADDLDRYLADKPILARRSTRGERVWRWCRRNPLTASLVFGLASILLVGLGISLLAMTQFRDLAERESESARDAQIERGKAEDARKQAERANVDVTRQVIRLNVAAALRAEADGDPFSALAAHAEALRLAHSRQLNERPHRIRIGRLFQSLPRLETIWPPLWSDEVPSLYDGRGFFKLSPDGKRAMTGTGNVRRGRQRSTILWDAFTGRKLATLSPRDDPGFTTRFSRDTRYVCLTWADGRARVWHANTGKPAGPVMRHGERASASFLHNGSRLITKSTPPKRRCFIWDFTTGKVVFDFARQREEVAQFDLSPDGRYVLTESPRARIRVWNLKTLSPATQHLQLPKGPVGTAFSPDGEWIAAADTTHNARALNIVTRQQRKMANAFPVARVAFTPDGSGILCRGRQFVALWDVGTGKRVGTAKFDGLLRDVIPSTDGNRLVLIGRNPPHKGVVFDNATGRSFPLPGVVSSSNTSPRLNTRNQRLIATTNGKNVYLFDIESGTQTVVLRHRNSVRRARVLADGRYVATTDAERNAVVWDGVTGVPLTPPLPHHHRVLNVKFDNAGQSVITHDSSSTIRQWNLKRANPVATRLQHRLPITAIAFRPDGKRILTAAYDGEARLWHAKSGRIAAVLSHQGIVRDAVFSPNGKMVATVDSSGKIQLWDADTGTPKANGRWMFDRQTQSLRFSRDSRRLVACGRNIGVWDITGESPKLLRKFSIPVQTAEFDPTGRLLVVGGHQIRTPRAAIVLEIATGRQKAVLHTVERRVFTATAFSPDGRYIVAATARFPELFLRDRRGQNYSEVLGNNPLPGELFLFDAKTYKRIANINRNGGVRFAAFSRDSRFVVTASDNATARVRASATGQPLTPVLRHEQRIRYAVFGPKGQFVATAGDDKTARVWNAGTGESIAVFRHPGNVTRVSFSPDGTQLLTACDDGIARLFELRADRRSVLKLVEMSRLLSSRRIDKRGATVPLDTRELKRLREARRGKD